MLGYVPPFGVFSTKACSVSGSCAIYRSGAAGNHLSAAKQFSIWVKKLGNVVKTIINHPLGNGLYHPFMVILGMVYYCFAHLKGYKVLCGGQDFRVGLANMIKLLWHRG